MAKPACPRFVPAQVADQRGNLIKSLVRLPHDKKAGECSPVLVERPKKDPFDPFKNCQIDDPATDFYPVLGFQKSLP
jgi:hypothetical protein